MHDYVRKILAARVYDVAIESPLDPMPRLSQRLGERGPPEAGGSPAGLLVQAPRRLQQDGQPAPATRSSEA